MTQRRSISNTFHRMGDSYSHYFNPDHFMGQGALSDIWDLRHNTKPMVIIQDLKINIDLPGFNESEIEITPFGNKIKIKASIVDGKVGEIQDEYLVNELHMESFNRTITVPDELDITKLNRAYDGKTLKISIPYLPK